MLITYKKKMSVSSLKTCCLKFNKLKIPHKSFFKKRLENNINNNNYNINKYKEDGKRSRSKQMKTKTTMVGIQHNYSIHKYSKYLNNE